MSATTAGRMPLNMLSTTLLSANERKNMASITIMPIGTAMLPKTAQTAPSAPRCLNPTWVAMFTAKMPGIDWAMAMASINSCWLSHWRLSTTSRSMSGIMA